MGERKRKGSSSSISSFIPITYIGIIRFLTSRSWPLNWIVSHETYLEDTDKSLRKIIKSATPYYIVIEVKLPSKKLHP